jgi:HSP20 family molecular chaperone IbpA
MTENKGNEAHEEVRVERMEGSAERPYYSPLVDIYEEDDVLFLVTDMPGVGAAGVEVTCQDGVLTLNGRIEPRTTPGTQLLYEEYVPGDYHRCFRVSDDVDLDRISAKISNGVLTVTMPKSERVRKRRIQVK